ncbi:MAG TPA: hypothetical protein VGQ30_03980 [Gemmatimonadaceae bacterium]|nr:hypothetical protein [Gemmatimonadaceae bacterium]
MARTLATVSLMLTASAAARAQAPHRASTAVPSPASDREARGIVSRITPKGDVPLAGNWVVLHRVGKDAAAPIDSTRTDAAGRFVFHYRATGDSSAMYFIASSYDGIAYFTPPLRNAVTGRGDADLLVYDTTSGPVPVSVRGRHVIVTAPDTGKTRGIIEVYELANDSSVTRVAGIYETPTFETTVPAGVTGFVATDGDIPADAVKFDNGRVRVFAPIAPGIKQLSFHYRVPLTKGPITIPSIAPTAVLEVLVEDLQGDATGASLKKMASVNIEGRPFKRFLAQNSPGNSVVSAVAPSRPGAAFSTRMAIIVIGIGAAMLAGLGASLMRKGPLVARAHELGGADPDDIARQIAALDDAFEKKQSPSEDERADHYESRARMKAKLTSAIARRDGL